MMKSKHLFKYAAILVAFSSLPLAFVNCSGMVAQNLNGASSGLSNAGLTNASIPTAGANVMQVQVGNCGSIGYVNEICANVTICSPGSTTNCQTIPNILVDTGSYGLRVFQSVLSVSLNQVLAADGGKLSTCAQFADGSSEWGPVQTADIMLGTQRASNVPMQVLNTSNSPSACPNPDGSPSVAGFNGILGVGLFAQDCGAACVSDRSNGAYFSCTGTNCVGATASLTQQVANPVTFLPVDNNGVVVMLPAINSGGATSVTGALVFGIGTEANNAPGTALAFPADTGGDFVTVFNGADYTGSFIDSGSNALYFPGDKVVSLCSDGSGFFCPTNLTALTAIQEGFNSTPMITVPFSIMSAATIPNSGAYNDIGGSTISAGSTPYFDWGLPFFFGRAIYVGVEGASSSLGTGPYWAF